MENAIWLMVWLGCFLAGLLICAGVAWRLGRPDHESANWDTIAWWMCIATLGVGGGGILWLVQFICNHLDPAGGLYQFLSEMGIFFAGAGWIVLFVGWFYLNRHHFSDDEDNEEPAEQSEGESSIPRARLVVINSPRR